LAQAISRTAEDLSRTQAIRICGGQNGNGIGFLRVNRISLVDIIVPVFHFHPSSVTETKQFKQFESSLNKHTSILTESYAMLFSGPLPHCYVSLLVVVNLVLFYDFNTLVPCNVQ